MNKRRRVSGRPGSSLRQRVSRLVGVALLVVLTSCAGGCNRDQPASETLSADPPATPVDLVVSILGSNSRKVLLLYSGMRGGTCQTFEQHVGVQVITLPQVSYSPTTCPVEIDVFAPGLGATALATYTSLPGSDAWFTSALSTGSLDIALSPAVRLPIKFWLLAEGVDVGTATDMRDRLLNKAYPILDAMATGLTLDTASVVLAITEIEPHCSSSDNISQGVGSYDAKALNVYFVEKYGFSNSTSAMNCKREGHQEIVFIVWANEFVTDPTLAHEIGHSLALVHPETAWGHTDYEPGFSGGNYMALGADITDLSIGQRYAMNFAVASWLNRTGSPIAKSQKRACADSWTAGPCPSLKDFAAGWPP